VAVDNGYEEIVDLSKLRSIAMKMNILITINLREIGRYLVMKIVHVGILVSKGWRDLCCVINDVTLEEMDCSDV
jgi:hypothetical protein